MWAPVGRTRSVVPGQAEKGQLTLLVGFSFRHSVWDLVSGYLSGCVLLVGVREGLHTCLTFSVRFSDSVSSCHFQCVFQTVSSCHF